MDVADQDQLLRVFLAQRGDEDPLLGKLVEQRRGESGDAGGDQDAVEGGLLGPAERAVADPVADVGAAQTVEDRAARRSESVVSRSMVKTSAARMLRTAV